MCNIQVAHHLDVDRDVPAPLSAEVLSHLQDLPPPPVFQEVVPETSKTSASTPAGSSAEKKVPKWLKVGSKHTQYVCFTCTDCVLEK